MPRQGGGSRQELLRTCDRCGWDYHDSQLRKDAKSGHYYCVVGLHCFDEPGRDDLKNDPNPNGFVFR